MSTPFVFEFHNDKDFARQLDEDDPLREFRELFFIPRRSDGSSVVYFCGHSLGLQPRAVSHHLEQELDDWANLAVDAHFHASRPWYSYHELFRDCGASLVGALPGEVVMMNSLTVNLHLMLSTFYQPTKDRFKILTDEPSFPSDLFALQTHIAQRGLDPAVALVKIAPRPEDQVIQTEDLEQLLTQKGSEIAVVLLNGVNFFTGQRFDIARITSAAKRHGCVVGFDLAHAAGNVPMQLHEWGVDFAVWCSYKYLNSGPGAVAGCFVHERHANDPSLVRLAGWWGTDPASRFQRNEQFVPRAGADGWQVSNPPILAMAPLLASLKLFDDAGGMTALRDKSQKLTGFLHFLLQQPTSSRFNVITPSEPQDRGCQLSVLVQDEPRTLLQELQREGVVCDFREPNVIRMAPVPLYNTFSEVYRVGRIMLNA